MNKTKKSHQLLKHFFILIVLVFSLGQLQRFQLTPNIAVYAHDLLIFAWLSWFAIVNRAMIGTYLKFIVDWFHSYRLIAMLVIWVLAGMVLHFVVSGFVDLHPFLYLLRAMMYLALALASRKVLRPYYLRSFWTTAGLIILALGLLQYILLPDMRFLFIFGWDDHYYRLISSLFDPAFTGMILVFCFAYFYSLNFYPEEEQRHLNFLQKPFFKILTLLLIANGILLTYSRSSLLAFGIMVGLLGLAAARNIWRRRQSSWWKRKFILTALVMPPIMFGVYLAAPKPGGLGVDMLRSETAQARIDNSVAAVTRTTPKTLIIGEGLFTPTLTSSSIIGINHARVPDNLLVMLLTAVGIPGLFLSLYGLLALGLYLYRHDKILFSAYLGLLIHAQFNNTLLQPFVLLYFLGGISSINHLANSGNAR